MFLFQPKSMMTSTGLFGFFLSFIDNHNGRIAYHKLPSFKSVCSALCPVFSYLLVFICQEAEAVFAVE
jgi:hypothetical protein